MCLLGSGWKLFASWKKVESDNFTPSFQLFRRESSRQVVQLPEASSSAATRPFKVSLIFLAKHCWQNFKRQDLRKQWQKLPSASNTAGNILNKFCHPSTYGGQSQLYLLIESLSSPGRRTGIWWQRPGKAPAAGFSSTCWASWPRCPRRWSLARLIPCPGLK